MEHNKLFLVGAFLGLLVATPVEAADDDGGPDYYEVTGLKSVRHLNIRNGASLEAAVIGGVLNGAKLKNMGCSSGANGRWCQVETDKGLKGYAFGKFLKEATSVVAAPAEAMKKVPAFALGKLKCEKNNGSPVIDCNYGLIRFAGGIVRLQVVWPDATKRTFALSGTVATSKEGPVVVKLGDDKAYHISITPTGAAGEHYMIPADAVTGAK